jgi:hypothetical protein
MSSLFKNIFSSTTESGSATDHGSETDVVEEKKPYDIQVEKINKFKKIDEDRNIKIYKTSVYDLIDLSLNPYRNNRSVDNSHVFTLTEGIKNSKCVYHNLILIHNLETKVIEVCDGQHRYEALKNLSPTDQKEISCWIHVHEFYTKDDKYIFDFFKKINNNKGISIQELDKHEQLSIIMEYLENEFGSYRGNKRIYDEKLKSEPVWRLEYKKLKDELEKRWDKIRSSSKQEIYNKIKEYNNTFVEKYMDEVYTQKVMKNKNNKEMLTKYNFYLNINFPNNLDIIFMS